MENRKGAVLAGTGGGKGMERPRGGLGSGGRRVSEEADTLEAVREVIRFQVRWSFFPFFESKLDC